MKPFIVGTFALVALGAPAAIAADLSPHAYTKAPAVDPAYNWSGFYVGANAGYGWGSANPSTTTEFTPTNYWAADAVPIVNAAGTGSRLNASGFVGGGQAGYNYQMSNLLLGAEVDFDSFRLKASRFGAGVFPNTATFVLNQTESSDWLFTARGRIGLAIDHWLFYGTGGLAVTNLNYSESYRDAPTGANEAVTASKTLVGWTAGAGVEYGITRNWSIKAEYLYLDFHSGLSNISLLNGTPGAVNTRMFHSADLTANLARLGINYRF